MAARLKSQFARLVRDENGTEMVEAVLVLGLIVVTSLMAMSVFGDTLARRWNYVLESL